jgi:hypothetical protein
MIRVAAVRVTRELEDQARKESGLGYLPLGALVRIGLATLAGYDRDEAMSRFFLDPTGKRYQKLTEKLDLKETNEHTP